MASFFDHLQELLAEGTSLVTVTLVQAVGSAPADVGAKMIVTTTGRVHGTVGGGKLEAAAIAYAQKLIEARGANALVHWNLQTDIKMTCGGSVQLFFEAYLTSRWPIAIFGAGHVAQALIRTLLNLNCHITCRDQRSDWLAKLPQSSKLTTLQATDLPAQVPAIPDGAFVLLMTQGHSVDSPILAEVLKTDRFGYIGVIGSKAKRLALKKSVIEAGGSEEAFARVHCPMGLELGTNDPHEIAISITAQLIQERDRLKIAQ